MAYLPKSKYKILYTAGGELIYKGSTKIYIGSYIKVSDGSYYKGKDITKLNIKLIKPLLTQNGKTHSVMQGKYNKLKPGKFNFLKKVKVINSTKPLPILEDYKKGYIKRYFVKRNNEALAYFEINKKTHESIKKRKGEYDHNLYTIGFIEWSLEGNVVKTNKTILDKKEKKFPHLSLLFPLLDEFSKTKNKKHNIKGRLYSNGKEIPTNLPPTYGLPKQTNQYCQNCTFKNKTKCGLWDAYIKSGYWCKSWGMIATNAPTFIQTQLPQYRNQTNIKNPHRTNNNPSGGRGGGY